MRFAAYAAFAAAPAWPQSSLADASLEQLLNTQVTSVARKEQDLAHAAAAVFVLGPEDIRRSGAATVPDLLRIVPGVEVAQINGSTWAISIRGFNQRYSNKVLVLVDGRSVYTPSLSGVNWDQLDMPLENIDRIEVVRGPGASVWGANAMNGVINIITKSPDLTHGAMVSADVDSRAGASISAQVGGGIGPGQYRAYAKLSRFGESRLAGGAGADDPWFRTHGGFRSDWSLSHGDSVMVEAEAYANRDSERLYHWFIPVAGDVPYRYSLEDYGGDVLARWTHNFANGSSATFQTYYDEFQRNDPQVPGREKTFDFDFQHHFSPTTRHDIVWGLGYRAQSTYLLPGYKVALNPSRKVDSLFSGFVQDQIRIGRDIWLTLGAKIERNSYTGLDTEPSARIAWAPDASQTLWASASKAIRQPSRIETGVSLIVAQYPLEPGVDISYVLSGNPRLRSEQLRDYEIGYRRQWTARLSLDIDAFLSFYNDLSTFEEQSPVVSLRGFPGLAPFVAASRIHATAQSFRPAIAACLFSPSGCPLPAAGQVVSGAVPRGSLSARARSAVAPTVMATVPVVYGNGARAMDYGGEALWTWTANSRWRLAAGYSMVAMNYKLEPGIDDDYTPILVGATPRNSFQVRSRLNLTRRIDFDSALFWNQGFPNGEIAAHARVDARLAWRPAEAVELSLGGQDLLRPGFLEFGNFEAVAASECPRQFVGKITWRF